MERNIQKNGLINLLILLLVGVAGFVVARLTNTLTAQVESVFLALGILVAAASWVQMRLEESERVEKLELEELARAHGTSALFEGKETDVFPAQRAREQFERFFVPAFTAALCLIQAGGAFLLWRWLARPDISLQLKQPMAGLFVFFLFALVLFLLGRFSATYARLENQRLLKPGASYLLLNAVLCGAVGAAVIGVQAGWPRTDWYLAHALCLLLAIIAAETLVALVLEIYRPRVKGKVGRPLYDSRLVGLLGQPEGLITTAAQAIDYQFGFKVSETWFYRFFERAIFWLLPLQILLLLLSTGLVIVQPGEECLLERFGKPVPGRTLLGPGAHLKFPWPVDRVYRYRTEQIQTLAVGFIPDLSKEAITNAMLWTIPHLKEENFIVANNEPSALNMTNEDTGKRTPPVSLLTVSIPVQYQITNLVDWAYNNSDAPSLLQDLATREVIRYLVGVDLSSFMTSGRLEASEALARRMQAAADDHHLGARILTVALGDIHPPVKVAPEYEKVVAATQTRDATILEADAYAIQTNALSGAAANGILNQASAAATNRTINAFAQAALFTNQIPAFNAAPSVYAERAYLKTFADSTTDARKYLLLTTNTHDVIIFDLQDSVARDLLNLKVPPPKP